MHISGLDFLQMFDNVPLIKFKNEMEKKDKVKKNRMYIFID